MDEVRTRTGGCHCGRVRFEVTTDLRHVIRCNCSLCAKRGWYLTFVPETQFRLLSGQDVLTEYQFNKKVIHHLFCKLCGIESFARGVAPNGEPMCSINVRCLDDVRLEALAPVDYDGKNH